ncbi:MAG: hypothetical protein PHW63_04850, partial [Alphaproteobacteria bacterium]|nr:hypothetical protein [Alphaproteobacteria bacterium]
DALAKADATPAETIEGTSIPLSTREMMARHLAEGYRLTSVLVPTESVAPEAVAAPVEFTMPMSDVAASSAQETIVSPEHTSGEPEDGQAPVVSIFTPLALFASNASLMAQAIVASTAEFLQNNAAMAHMASAEAGALMPSITGPVIFLPYTPEDDEKNKANPHTQSSARAHAGRDGRTVARQHPVASGREHLARAYAGAYPLRLRERLDAEMAAVQDTVAAPVEPAKPGVIRSTLKKLAASVVPFTRSMLRTVASRVMQSSLAKKMMTASPFTGTVSSLEDHVRAHVEHASHTGISKAARQGRAALHQGDRVKAKMEAIATEGQARRARINAEYTNPTPSKASIFGSRISAIAHNVAVHPAVIGIRLTAASMTGMTKNAFNSSYMKAFVASGFAILGSVMPLQSDNTAQPAHAPEHMPIIKTPMMGFQQAGAPSLVEPRATYPDGPIYVAESTLTGPSRLHQQREVEASASAGPAGKDHVVVGENTTPKAFKQALSTKGAEADALFAKLPPELQKQISKLSRDMKAGVPKSKGPARQLMHFTKEASFALLRAGTEANNRAALDLLKLGASTSKTFNLDHTVTGQQIIRDASIMLSGGYKGIPQAPDEAATYAERMIGGPSHTANIKVAAAGPSAGQPRRARATFALGKHSPGS